MYLRALTLKEGACPIYYCAPFPNQLCDTQLPAIRVKRSYKFEVSLVSVMERLSPLA